MASIRIDGEDILLVALSNSIHIVSCGISIHDARDAFVYRPNWWERLLGVTWEGKLRRRLELYRRKRIEPELAFGAEAAQVIQTVIAEEDDFGEEMEIGL